MSFRNCLSVFFTGVLLSSCAFEPLFKDGEEDCITPNVKHHRLTLKVKANGYPSLKLEKLLDCKKGLIEGKLKYDAILTVTITEEFGSVGMTTDGLTNRGQGRIAIDLTLADKLNPAISKTAHFDQVSSYNIDDGDSFSYDRTQASVRNRLLLVLSDQIIRETLYLVD